jgi:hypothetical protein
VTENVSPAFKRVVIESTLQPDTMVQRISAALDPEWSVFHRDRAFYGSVAKSRLRLMPAPEGEAVVGVSSEGVSTKVEIAMSWPPLAVFWVIGGLLLIPLWSELGSSMGLAARRPTFHPWVYKRGLLSAGYSISGVGFDRD